MHLMGEVAGCEHVFKECSTIKIKIGWQTAICKTRAKHAPTRHSTSAL
jgi:hypothetical protein